MSNLWVELAEQRRTRLSRVNTAHLTIYQACTIAKSEQCHTEGAGYPGPTDTYHFNLCMLDRHA